MLRQVSGNGFCFQNYLKADPVSRLLSSQYVILAYDPAWINQLRITQKGQFHTLIELLIYYFFGTSIQLLHQLPS